MGADYSTWLTKQQAADAIGVTTKTVEQLAKDRKLEQAFWRRPTGGPQLAVYNPEDVARIASERQPAAMPFVLPAVQTGANGHGRAHRLNGTQALAAIGSPAPAADDLVRQFLEGLMRAASTPPSSEKSQKSFLTIAEAAMQTGLTQAYLRRAIDDGTLKAVRDRGWRIRRRDLEQL